MANVVDRQPLWGEGGILEKDGIRDRTSGGRIGSSIGKRGGDQDRPHRRIHFKGSWETR